MMTNIQIVLKNLKGKHIKQLLTKIELLQMHSIELRKIILDEINDLMRDIEKELGLDDTN